MPNNKAHAGRLRQVGLRLEPETADLLDAWAEANGLEPARAARVLLARVLHGGDLTWDEIGYREGFRRGLSDVGAALHPSST